MKKILIMFFMVLWCISAEKSGQINSYNKFQKYPIKVYKGEIKIPSTYSRDGGRDDYLDENDFIGDDDLPVDEIKINFADRYRVVHHSCGTGCGSYSLIDLSTGEEDFEIFKEFSDSIVEGKGVVISHRLHTKAGSTLLISSRTIEMRGCGICENVDEGWRSAEEEWGKYQKQYLLKTSQDGKNYLEAISDYEPCDSEWE